MTRKPIAGPAQALINLKRLSVVAAGIALTAAVGFATPSLAGPTNTGCKGKGFIRGGGTDAGCGPVIKGGKGSDGGVVPITTHPTTKTTNKGRKF